MYWDFDWYVKDRNFQVLEESSGIFSVQLIISANNVIDELQVRRTNWAIF